MALWDWRMLLAMWTVLIAVVVLLVGGGVEHPSALSPETVAILDEQLGARSLREVFNYDPHWGVIHQARPRALN